MSKFIFKTLDDSSLKMLANGAVAVIPTDTVYGIVTQVKNRRPVGRLYGLKNRTGDPGTIIAANLQQIIDMGVAEDYVKTASRFWPNPISVILPVNDNLDYLHLGKMGIAFRVVADEEIRKLLEVTGPLLTTSANRPGEPVANTILEAKEVFGERVDLYVDGGDLSGAKASTILKIDETGIHILRDGSIKVTV
jgi:L-threonylcarbamoyladenylate synthase